MTQKQQKKAKSEGMCVRVCVRVRVCTHLVTQSCLMICDPMDCNPSVSSVHGILQARILEWVCHSLLQGIFLGFLLFRWILYHLNHQGSPRTSINGSVGKWCSQKTFRSQGKKMKEVFREEAEGIGIRECSTGGFLYAVSRKSSVPYQWNSKLLPGLRSLCETGLNLLQ